jgi:hypothetical protein
MYFARGAIAGIAVLVLAVVPAHAQDDNPPPCSGLVGKNCGDVIPDYPSNCCTDTAGIQWVLQCTAGAGGNVWVQNLNCQDADGTNLCFLNSGLARCF